MGVASRHPSSNPIKLMLIVRPSPISVQMLAEETFSYPTVDELRPPYYPHCGRPSRDPSRNRLGIIGHGFYHRQVLGFPSLPYAKRMIRVRRYLCLGCGQTISVLPSEIHPHRWYAAPAILLGLFQRLVLGKKPEEVHKLLDGWGESRGWKTLRRWRRDLLSRLWGLLAARLGVQGEASSPEEGARRLTRLLGQGSLHPPWGEGLGRRVQAAASEFLSWTWHWKGKCRPMTHPSLG